MRLRRFHIPLKYTVRRVIIGLACTVLTWSPVLSQRPAMAERDSLLAVYRADESFQYGPRPEKKGERAPGMTRPGDANILSNLLVALTVLILGGLSVAWWYKNWYRPVRLFTHGDDAAATPQAQQADLATQITAALGASDFREATRLLFLDALAGLRAHNYIQWQQDKTNTQYLQELRGTPVYPHFRQLMHFYDYTWYGNFPANQDQYSEVSAAHTRLYQSLGGKA